MCPSRTEGNADRAIKFHTMIARFGIAGKEWLLAMDSNMPYTSSVNVVMLEHWMQWTLSGR